MHIKEGEKDAIIFLNKDELFGDPNTMKQIRQMVRDPSVEHPRIMPDCHYGNSCCVGFTSHITEKTVPRYIGGDIGCGITMYPLSCNAAKKIRKNPEKINAAILSTVPVGNAKRATPLTRDLSPVLSACTYTGKHEYDDTWLEDTCVRIGTTTDKIALQLGTLGGGNHFIEIGEEKDDSGSEQMYVTVHSGSRGLGQDVCRWHQDIITRGTKKDFKGFEKALRTQTKRLKSKDKATRLALEEKLREEYLGQTHERYLEGEEAELYFSDMIFAQEYARYNRYLMISQIVSLLGMDIPEPDSELFIESVHNYIDFEDGVWRKGAIRADEGRTIIVALNMRDGVFLAKGKGNPEWNNSAPHGAGRKYARNRARLHTTMKEFTADMKEVYSTCVTPATLDESPIMYKAVDLVRERSADTCEFTTQIVPLINIKGA